MSPTQQKNSSRRTLLIVAAVFIVPLIAAKLVLMLHWYQTAATNKGQLIDPPISISSVDNAALPDTWRIGVLVSNSCATACEHGLYVVNQSYHALGRLQNRVSPIALQDDSPGVAIDFLPANTKLQVFLLPHSFEQLAQFPLGSLFIMDPMGNVMLWYEGSDDREHMIMQARDLLSDLKKMLKLSRVG